MEERELGEGSLGQLEQLSNRLYCAWQALLYGDDGMYAHSTKIGEEIMTIWDALDDLVENEKIRHSYVAEEMKKFEQGFAYVRPERDSSRRT